MIDFRCDVEVGTHPEPFWIDKKSNLTVCSRHKEQYDERDAEFGPFEWERLPDDFFKDKVRDL